MHEAEILIAPFPPQMEEQNSHITKLMEENRRYIRENGKLKSRTRGGVVNSASSYTDGFSSANNFSDDFSSASTYSDGFGGPCSQQTSAGDLEDRVLALQLQNSELALCLEREKRMRREAETRLERDEGYIRRLEDSVQVRVTKTLSFLSSFPLSLALLLKIPIIIETRNIHHYACTHVYTSRKPTNKEKG